jgi:hypothetical protein
VRAANERLYFLHIPKTGGTSLRGWLESRFAPGDVLPPEDPKQMLRRGRAAREDWRLATGHYGLLLPALSRVPMSVVTLLRDPLSRSVSHYRDIRSRPGHPLCAIARSMGFEQFVMSETGALELANLQCRFLGLRDVLGEFRPHWDMAARERAQALDWYTDPRLLGRARESLGQCLVVGLCERIDDAAERVAAAMEWPTPAPLPRLNASRDELVGSALSAGAVERVRSLTLLDWELYRVATAMAGGGGVPSLIPS